MDDYAYDLIVIGGGSGGLAASKEAKQCGAKKVLVFDYVVPTPHGTKWGLGGTCVNVGCVPKKLMHYAALMGPTLRHDAPNFGWKLQQTPNHDWTALVQTIQTHIRQLNFSYRVGLRKKGVEYINARASVQDPHTVQYQNSKGETISLTSRYILIAVGGRPHIPKDVKGARQFAITSDDLFSWPDPPNKTLVVGASYIALECAGALTELGFPVTVSVRSVPLRLFDRQCARKVQQMMREMGTRFVQALPREIVKLDNGKLLVHFHGDAMPEEIFDTVLYASGRTADTGDLHLEAAGVKVSEMGKIIATNEQSSVPSIFAIGDCLHESPELTPVAIRAGELLARRLFANSPVLMDYNLVPTTIFTPMEYGCCGYSEEKAIELFGEDALEIYLYEFKTLELQAAHRHKSAECRADDLDTDMSPNSFVKLICLKPEREKVIGFHFVGMNAGEITQGYALALRLGATKADFDDTVGIHPTDVEAFHSLSITKRSGQSWIAEGGCGGGKCG